MTVPFPPRSPAAIAAAAAQQSAIGACCGHTFAAHAPDGCRVCQLQGRTPVNGGRPCTGWRPVDPWTDPPGNVHLVGVEDTDRLPCSTTGCGHLASQHHEDPFSPTGLGGCRSCGSCPAWTYVIADAEVVDAEVGSSGDPLLDVVHDVLARHYQADGDGRWVACRDELVDAVRGWAAGALGIQVEGS